LGFPLTLCRSQVWRPKRNGTQPAVTEARIVLITKFYLLFKRILSLLQRMEYVVFIAGLQFQYSKKISAVNNITPDKHRKVRTLPTI
jgi:hypothetical protein